MMFIFPLNYLVNSQMSNESNEQLGDKGNERYRQTRGWFN